MTGVELKAWREAAGLTQELAADRLDIGRRSLIRYESGKADVPEEVVAAIAGMGPIEPPAAKMKAVSLAEAYDPVAAGLRPYPVSNEAFGPGMRSMDTREVKSPWKRVPGCCRVVHESIPNPIPFYPPEWAGESGVPTADGRVFFNTTGMLMRDYRAGRTSPVGAFTGERLKTSVKKARS